MKRMPIFNLRAILSGIALAAVLVACGDEQVTVTPIVTPPKPEKIDPISTEDHLVYVALNESVDFIWAPKIIMPDGTVIPLTDGKRSGSAAELYVDDQKNTYIVGSHTTGLTRRHYAVYWKNTVPFLLTDTLKVEDSFATDIVVSGGDVYVAGYVAGYAAGNFAVYWKNGTRVNLTDGKTDCFTTKIIVAGNDVYVTGAIKNITTDKYEARYWKNGMEVKLPGANSINDILVSGDDLYITGSFGTDTGTAKYWKNGSLVTLEANEGGTGNILLSDGSVYITGVARYWKDNVAVNMLSETSRPNLTSITVLDDVVYLGSFEAIGGFYVPRIWKNGVPTTLNDGKHNGNAKIFVVRK